MWAARELLSEVDQKIAGSASSQRVVMLGHVIDLLKSQPAPLEAALEAVFDAVIQRLAADVEIRDRIKISERLAKLEQAPRGVLRQFAHDKLPVARPIISSALGLKSNDLVSVAESRGQPHMRVIADRPHLETGVTDVLVVRGDEDVVSAVAGNKTASFSEAGLQELATRAVGDEALYDKLAIRTDIPGEKLKTLMAAAEAAMATEMAHHMKADKITRAVSSGDYLAIETVANEISDRDVAQDELAIEKLIAAGTLSEEHVLRFIEDRRLHAVTMSIAHFARMDIEIAQRLLASEDAEGLIFLCRSFEFSWSTTRAMILLRATNAPRIDRIEQMMDMYHATTPQMARRIFAFRFSK